MNNEALEQSFNRIRDERIQDLENGMKRVMGEYSEIVGRLTSLNAKYERLHFMLTGLPPKDTRIICKLCGKVLGMIGEVHECER